MKKKIVLGIAFCFCGALASYAQASDAETEAAVNLLSVQKREAIKKLVPVTGKDSIAFWKIYNEYEKENKSTIQTRVKLYENTVRAYSKMTPDIADELAAEYFSNRKVQEKGLEDYYKKIKTATNALIGFEFYQAETFLLTQLRATIMQQIPTYGELRNMGKNQ